MLTLSLLAPLAVELQTAPIQRFRDHKRIEVRCVAASTRATLLPRRRERSLPGVCAQVSSTFQAPWDYNLDNIIDNVRLSWFSRWNTGPVRRSLAGHRLRAIVLTSAAVSWAGGSQRASQLR